MLPVLFDYMMYGASQSYAGRRTDSARCSSVGTPENVPEQPECDGSKCGCVTHDSAWCIGYRDSDAIPGNMELVCKFNFLLCFY